MIDDRLSSTRVTETSCSDSDAAPRAVQVADVDICLCTFRRPHVADTIASLARQTASQPALNGAGRAPLKLRVIVADNDETPSAREIVQAALAAHGLDGVYLHAPSRNISIARNACLDAVTAPLAAFIDDDETARPDWLGCLVDHMRAGGADVVLGRVAAIYPDGASRWLVAADLHSTQAVVRAGEVTSGYTCNVLFRAAALGGLRFDLADGKTGGEDTLYFSALHRRGVRLAYCPDAVVDEPVAAARLSLGWLMRRSYRSGQTHAAMLMQSGAQKIAIAAPAFAKVFWCAASALLSAWSPVKWRKAAVRGALHAGVVGASLGRRTLELYGADANERA